MASDLSAPSPGKNCVTAVFDDQADAEKARADLQAQGFAAEDIEIKSSAARLAETTAPAEDPSIWSSLLGIFVFMPSQDRMTIDEALRRGGVALAVRTDRANYERAIDILDRDGAVDLEEREVKWVEDGWTPASSGDRSGPADPADAAQRHDPLVSPDANADVRERIGTGTSDMTVGTDVAPANAASIRDTSHGRARVRSYTHPPESPPTGIDPAI